MLALLESFAGSGLAGRQRRDARLQGLLGVAETLELVAETPTLGGERGIFRRHQSHGQVALLGLERLVLLRLASLPLERAELPLHLVHHVAHAHEVLAGGVELALGLVALLFVSRDPGRFLDEHAPLVRLRGEDVIELLLIHHRVRTRVRAGAGEEVEDIAQAGGVLVEEVLALAGAVEAPAHRDLGPRHRQHTVVAEGQLGFGEAHRLPRRRAVEDQVFHALAAQRFRALLAECPADRLRDVALAASVGTDDRGDSGGDLDGGFFGERFEAVKRDGLEAHEVF